MLHSLTKWIIYVQWPGMPELKTATKNTNIFFDLYHVFSLQDEKNQVMTTNVWLDQEWDDELLIWNPHDFGGRELTAFRGVERKRRGWYREEVFAIMLSDYVDPLLPTCEPQSIFFFTQNRLIFTNCLLCRRQLVASSTWHAVSTVKHWVQRTYIWLDPLHGSRIHESLKNCAWSSIIIHTTNYHNVPRENMSLVLKIILFQATKGWFDFVLSISALHKHGIWKSVSQQRTLHNRNISA